jgi:hypothetical protein
MSVRASAAQLLGTGMIRRALPNEIPVDECPVDVSCFEVIGCAAVFPDLGAWFKNPSFWVTDSAFFE